MCKVWVPSVWSWRGVWTRRLWLLCNNALFFESCPSHPIASCDLRQRCKSSTASCSALAGRGTGGKNPDMDWKWLDDFLVSRVTASPGVFTPYETGAGNATNHISPQACQNIQIWRNEYSKILGECKGTPSPTSLSLVATLSRSGSSISAVMPCMVSDSRTICYHLSSGPAAVQNGEQGFVFLLQTAISRYPSRTESWRKNFLELREGRFSSFFYLGIA